MFLFLFDALFTGPALRLVLQLLKYAYVLQKEKKQQTILIYALC